MADPLALWVAQRAPAVLVRAEEEAVTVLRDHLVRAALGQAARATPARNEQPAPREAPPDATSRSGELLWAYGVIDAGAEVPLAEARGIDAPAPVERIEAAGVAALVSRVPRHIFDAEPLRGTSTT